MGVLPTETEFIPAYRARKEWYNFCYPDIPRSPTCDLAAAPGEIPVPRLCWTLVFKGILGFAWFLPKGASWPLIRKSIGSVAETHSKAECPLLDKDNVMQSTSASGRVAAVPFNRNPGPCAFSVWFFDTAPNGSISTNGKLNIVSAIWGPGLL